MIGGKSENFVKMPRNLRDLRFLFLFSFLYVFVQNSKIKIWRGHVTDYLRYERITRGKRLPAGGRNLLKLVSSLICCPHFGLYSEFSQLRIFASIGYHNQASGSLMQKPTPTGHNDGVV